MSHREDLKIPYGAIMDRAVPGDILFFISDAGQLPRELHRRIYRQWRGLDPGDTTDWHTAIYVGEKKESKGAQHRPYIVHSDQKGTVKEFVPPGYFRNHQLPQGLQKCRIEIVHHPDISPNQRQFIVDFSRSQLGKPFDGDGWRQDFITYSLGIKSRPRNPETVSCHGLAYLAYGLIGLEFPHQLQSAPNLLGRFLGHPLGHPKDHVDLDSNYLRDHHLYRDPRFKSVLAVAGVGPDIKDVITRADPGKYSWDTALQIAYGFLLTADVRKKVR